MPELRIWVDYLIIEVDNAEFYSDFFQYEAISSPAETISLEVRLSC
jgi:hypothetical protein